MAGKSVITVEFRVSYPKVFEPELNTLNDKMEYSLVALFPKGADIKNIQELALEAANEMWPKKRPKNFKSPFRDQAEREIENDDGSKVMPEGYVKGATFITMKSRQQPGIVDKKRKPILDAEEFYAGCWARAEVTAFAYEAKGNAGVSIWVQNLQKTRDDESLSGRRKAEDVFSAIDDDDEEQASPVADPFAE